MKSIQLLRIIFVMIVVIGGISLLAVAAKVSAENLARPTAKCATCNPITAEPTNTEFIFFESVTRYLVFAVSR